MFNGKKSKTTTAPPRQRIDAIATRSPPEDYVDAKGSGTRPERQPVYRQAVAILPHGERLTVAIKSISATGLRIEYFQNIFLPDTFVIKEATLPLDAQVRVAWQRRGSAGLRVIGPSAR